MQLEDIWSQSTSRYFQIAQHFFRSPTSKPGPKQFGILMVRRLMQPAICLLSALQQCREKFLGWVAGGKTNLRMARGCNYNYSHINYDPFAPVQILPSPIGKNQKLPNCVISLLFPSGQVSSQAYTHLYVLSLCLHLGWKFENSGLWSKASSRIGNLRLSWTRLP